MKRNEKQENAVSPVVGVMLMLVVTIVIAAVVAVFATGVVTSTEPAPVAMLTATVDSTWDNGYTLNNGKGTVMITSLSGDTVDFGKVKTIVSVEIDTKTYTYTYVGRSGEKLDSGSTFNLAYKCSGFTYNSTNYKTDYGLTSLLGLVTDSKSLNSGDYVHVTVVYDDQHILYDKEVVAV